MMKSVFPLLKPQLLKANVKTEDTLTAPFVKEIIQEIIRAKEDAIDACQRFGIKLTLYDNISLVKDVKKVVDRSVPNDEK